MAAAPWGWSGKAPDFIQLIGESLSAQLDPGMLIGQSGGAMPNHDIGPWFDDASSEWWFFDPGTSRYQPGEQGCPIGTIVLYPGKQNDQPPGWILCDGSEVSRSTYSRLFQAIGETWGAGDGASTFNLPPGAKIYINAAGFVAVYQVPLDDTGTQDANGNEIFAPPAGVGSMGGRQNSGNLLGSDVACSPFDWMKVTFRAKVLGVANALEPKLPGTDIPSIQPAGTTAGILGTFGWSVTDMNGNALGKSQTAFLTMPPFVCINHIVKYQ
jgi:hypothetical protein